MVIVGYALADTHLVSRIRDRDVMLVLYPQVFLITALSFILFSPVGAVPRHEKSNETIRIRLNEQHEELAKAHAHETALSTNMARDQERERLLRDLHDVSRPYRLDHRPGRECRATGHRKGRALGSR